MVGRPGHVAPLTTAQSFPAEPLPGSPIERLRPRTAPQILDAGFEVLRFRAKTIAILLVVLHGPFYVASVVLLRQADDVSWPALLLSRLWTGRSLGDLPTNDLGWIAGSTVCALFGEMLFAVALATLIRGWLEGADPGPRAMVIATLRRFPAILAVWLLALVLKAIGGALCAVGLLLVVPYLSILGPVVAFEPGGIGHWVARSRELVTRAAPRALFLTLMAPVLSGLVSWGIEAGDALGITRFEQFSTIMGIAASMLLLVARCSTMTLFYLDIRVRTEGLDLALRAPRALGSPA
jgi:hypothetical protein